MTPPSVHVHIAPTSVPSTPSWLGDVAVVAHVFSQLGLQKAIEERVRFGRARLGDDEVSDCVVMLSGSAVSGERTLQSLYQRLLPFAEPFMALFGRANLPHPATLSRFRAALDHAPMEALRTLFQEDLVARSAFASPPGGVWDRLGSHWTVVDVDGTQQAVRQRARPQTADLPAPHRRFELVAAPAYLGRTRGEIARTRTTVLHAQTHHWLGTFGNAGTGDDRGELLRARAVISSSASARALPLSHVLTRLDGWSGNAAPLADLLPAGGPGVMVRGKDDHLLNLPAVRVRLQQPPDQQTRHPESGASRALSDCLDIPLTPTGLRVRMLLAARLATASPPAIGTLHNGMVSEQFFPTVPPHAFTPADVRDLYVQRGSFETVLADEDQEHDPDRWVSQTPCGQAFWHILSQWVWNLRLEFGQHVSASPMRVTALASSQMDEPVQASEAVKASALVKADASVSSGPAQWARRSFTKGFAGADVALQPDGTLRCPADHPLSPHERRAERDGSLRVLSAARIGHGRSCPLRAQCQEHSTTSKPRRVSAVFWPLTSTTSPPDEPLAEQPAPSRPVLWGEWERCHLRRHWFSLLRSQTVLLTFGSGQQVAGEDVHLPDVLPRAQRAQWRLRWEHRLARNARLPPPPPREVTIHGLPVSVAHVFGFDVATAASLLENTARFFFSGSLLFSVPSLSTHIS